MDDRSQSPQMHHLSLGTGTRPLHHVRRHAWLQCLQHHKAPVPGEVPWPDWRQIAKEGGKNREQRRGPRQSENKNPISLKAIPSFLNLLLYLFRQFLSIIELLYMQKPIKKKKPEIQSLSRLKQIPSVLKNQTVEVIEASGSGQRISEAKNQR